VTAYEIVEYGPSRRADYVRLLRDTRDGGGLSPEEFDWWFDGNPTQPRLMAVAEIDDRVVGVASHTPYRMRLDGRERLATASVHAGTDPVARGKGIFRALEVRNEEAGRRAGVAASLAFASKSTENLFLGPLGWSEIGRLRVWMRVLRPVAAARRALGRAPAPGTRRRGSAGGVRAIARFDESTDRAYELAAPAYGNHVIREAAFMNWRYADSPWGYRAFGLGDRAFAVVREKTQRGTPIAVVADLVVLPGSFRETRTLLKQAAAESGPDAVALFALPPRDPAQRRAFAASGFVPSPTTLHFVAIALAEDFELPLDPKAWHFSLGDTDFF
jgi:GNAT superfamily N-acetyltransferase